MGEPVRSRIFLVRWNPRAGTCEFSVDGTSYSFSGIDGAVIERIRMAATRKPGEAFNMAKAFGRVAEERSAGDMRRKDQEITNEPSAVADLTMWPGSTYSEGVGMKKLERVLGEGVATVKSAYFQATITSDTDDMECMVSVRQQAGEKMRGGLEDTKRAMEKALQAMDAALERAMV